MTEVLVVGAGPVGLLTALELATHGVDVTVIDARTDRGHRSKATTIWPRQLELLDRHRLAEEVIGHGQRLDRLTVATARRRLASLELNGLATSFPFGVSLSQHAFEAVLERALANYAVHVRRPWRLVDLTQSADGVVAMVDCPNGRAAIAAGYLVGADGVGSVVRERCQIPSADLGGPFSYVTTDVRVEGRVPPHDVAYYFSSAGSLSLVPLGDALYRVTLAVEATGDLLSRRGFQQAFDDRSGLRARLGRLPCEARFDVLFRHADAYDAGRAALVGNAAHSMSPAGGQGMNAGLQDAVNLAWRLRAALDVPARADDLLREYTEERRRDVGRALSTSMLLTRLGAARRPAALARREAVALGLVLAPGARRRLAARVAQLDGSYAQKARWRSGRPRALRVGDRFPTDLVRQPGPGWQTYGWALPEVSSQHRPSPDVVPIPPGADLRAVQLLGRRSRLVRIRPDGHVHEVLAGQPGPPPEHHDQHSSSR